MTDSVNPSCRILEWSGGGGKEQVSHVRRHSQMAAIHREGDMTGVREENLLNPKPTAQHCRQSPANIKRSLVCVCLCAQQHSGRRESVNHCDVLRGRRDRIAKTPPEQERTKVESVGARLRKAG